ncbi:MAG TPA: c-type cytochrome [Burkholderiales bacterium]|nr:c-type cytochrome [Burkholderiales bacterium]
MTAIAAPVATSDGGAMRAMFATSQDIAEGKRVAEASCASCHGLSGITKSKDKSVPNIAGQRPAYLYTELRVYQSGGRGNTPMNNAVKFLSDDALVKVAAYYANLDPAQPAAGGGKTVPHTDPVSAGKAAASGCEGCHGAGGVSQTPGMPNLAGQDPKYIVAAVKAYKSGQRKNDMMKTLVSAITDTELDNIALYFAVQKPGKAKTPSTGNQEAGKTAAVACAGCHGEGGVSIGTAPSLAGQDAQYLAAAIKEYKDGARNDQLMKAPAASVDAGTIKDLAAYYANQMPQKPNVRMPLTTQELAQRCDRCHGVNGNSTSPKIPALAAQRDEYLERVMHAYRRGDRRSALMNAMLDGVSDTEIEALAAHYSRQKARAVVYIPLPSK